MLSYISGLLFRLVLTNFDEKRQKETKKFVSRYKEEEFLDKSNEYDIIMSEFDEYNELYGT